MAEGTRAAQVAEAITTLRGENNALKEEQSRQGVLMGELLQQLNHLATSYDNLV